MRIDEIEARKGEIRELLAGENAELDLDALTEEVRALDAEAKQIRENAAKEEELRKAVDPAVEAEIKSEKEEERKMEKTLAEIRSTKEYGAAYLNMLKTGDDAEVRALLTTQVSGGQIPVPTQLESEIRTAWEQSQLMGLVKHSYFKGKVAIGFEKSATGASIHVEGAAAPTEETVTIGVVTLENQSIKKWITVSDEALEGTTVDTMGYLYKEIAHQIVVAAEGILVGKITASPATATATAVGVPVLAQDASVETIVTAVSMLSGEARDLRIVMNRQTYPVFMALALNANYGVDVFDGLKDRIVYSEAMPAYSATSSDDVYAIVGDFGRGAQANFPNGDNVTIKVDDASLAEKDLVKIVGRQYVGIGVVADRAFVSIARE